MSEKKRENAAGAAGAADRDHREQSGGPDEPEVVASGAEAADAATAGADDATGADDAAASAADATPDPVMVLEEEVAQLRDEVAAERDRLLRTVAEMDNLRKRSRREVQEAHRFARAEALRPMLEVLDNFDRALAHAGPDDGAAGEATAAPAAGGEATAGGDAAFRQGVEMIAQSFRQALRDQGVEPVAAIGEAFDPARHEAVGQQPAPEGTDSGTVIAVVQEGYTLGDLVLRASRVIVAQ